MPRSPSRPQTQTKQTRAWQRMLSGRRLDLLDPSPLDVEIADIAHGLARVARWNGQTIGPNAFSVAQHSLLVLEIADDLARQAGRTLWPAERMAVLLHDAPEYVIGDLISPFKSAIGLDYKAFELSLQRAIHLRFGLPPELTADLLIRIKSADRTAAYFEATRLAGFAPHEARQFFGDPDVSAALGQRLEELKPWPVDQAQSTFLETFEQIAEALQAAKR